MHIHAVKLAANFPALHNAWNYYFITILSEDDDDVEWRQQLLVIVVVAKLRNSASNVAQI